MLCSGDERYEVFRNTDNSEVRGENAVAVGVDETVQANFALPDYKDKISIYVSSHITGDEDGSNFNEICDEVKRRLDRYVLKEAPLSDLFEEIPVVGFWFDSIQKMVVDDTYGKCYVAHLKYTAVTSY